MFPPVERKLQLNISSIMFITSPFFTTLPRKAEAPPKHVKKVRRETLFGTSAAQSSENSLELEQVMEKEHGELSQVYFNVILAAK